MPNKFVSNLSKMYNAIFRTCGNIDLKFTKNLLCSKGFHAMASRKYEINMTSGPLLGKILLFAIPLALSSLLQLLFNAADVIVVGRYAGSMALAAVGSTSALINLLTNLFMGLSVGANVLFARYIGSNQPDRAKDLMHTSITISIICGAILTVIGLVFSRPLLHLMGTPDEVIGLASTYMKIYFLGMPAMLFYNFGSAILRAVGDTRRPLIFLTVSGCINVSLNIFFVTQLHMSVSGVALATIISQFISACLLFYCMVRGQGACHLEVKKLTVKWEHFQKIVSIGLPAGLQGMIFSLSNVLIQSSVNSFGAIAVAGNSAAANIEGFVWVAMNAFHQTAISFTSQNYGAREFKRVHKTLICCQFLVILTGLLLGNGAYFFGNTLLGFYNSDPEVIAYGLTRLKYICILYFTCGVMDTFVGSIRGLGYSFMPTIVSLLGACALRIVWILTIFRYFHSLEVLYVSYPITWILTLSIHFICYMKATKKLFGKPVAEQIGS